MKGKRPVDKINSYKILEGQTEKMKDKLENLKQQIKLKKQQKQMNKTSQSIGFHKNIYSASTASRMSTTNYVQKQDRRLYQALAELKIQNIEAKLKEKKIYKIEELLNLNEQQIDKWKDIPVGYRIKIKKYVQRSKNNQVPPLNVINEKQQAQLNPKDIQQIVKSRKAEQVYVALDRKTQQMNSDENQLGQQEQEEMMISLMSVFRPKKRSSSIKSNQKDIKQDFKQKHVHWSRQVDQMQKNHPKVKEYPKQTISKSIFHQLSEISQQQSQTQITPIQKIKIITTQKKQIPDYKYCWSCLRKIIKESLNFQNRHFCSKQCHNKYQLTTNPTDLINKFQDIQNRYNEFVADQKDYIPPQEQISFDIA